MKLYQRPLSPFILLHLIAILLVGSLPPAQAVPKQMENPFFWINKIKNPNRLLLTPAEIVKMNEENLKRQDLLLCRVEDLKEEWSKEEIISFLKEDWEGFGKRDQVRYGKQRIPLGDSFWNALIKNIQQDMLKEKNRLLFGFTLKRTDIRAFPTEQPSMKTPNSGAFDSFQLSAIAPGVLVGIYYFSRDNLWAYAQTPFIRGWIRTKDLAIANNRDEALARESHKAPLVITGNFVTIFSDLLFKQPVFSAQMGSTFPILHEIPSPLVGEGRGEGETDHNHPHLNPPPSRGRIIVGKFPLSKGDHAAIRNRYVIRIPFRGADGRLTFRHGYIPAHADVHSGFLPYTQKNMAQQAFKMLHQPYGWGEMSGGRDCSRFTMDLLNAFGILMPRNSNHQAKMGFSFGPLEGKTLQERSKILDQAVPLATLLRIPGHIMLYLGKHHGVHYAIHSIWGIQKKGTSGPAYQKIGKVVVTDLNLGKDGPNGSLFHRLTEIQLIGLDSEVNPVRRDSPF